MQKGAKWRFCVCFFSLKSAWIFACGFQLNRKTSPCIFFRWFALRFREITYAKNLPFSAGIFCRTRNKRSLLFRWTMKPVKHHFNRQLMEPKPVLQSNKLALVSNSCFVGASDLRAALQAIHSFSRGLVRHHLRPNVFLFAFSLLFFFFKPKHPFQEPVLAILQIENVFKFVFKATFD